MSSNFDHLFTEATVKNGSDRPTLYTYPYSESALISRLTICYIRTSLEVTPTIFSADRGNGDGVSD